MDLKIKDQQFLVCGASSGFGRAIAEQLLNEGASVIAVARRERKLQELSDSHPDRVKTVTGDLTDDDTHNKIEAAIGNDRLHGVVINAGGPPALSPLETAIPDWDQAYGSVMRWKVELILRLVSYFTSKEYGRILFIESQSVKQPIPSLVLSNAFRAGVVGFAKSLALEIADKGVTVHVLAPGCHQTPAIDRDLLKTVENAAQGVTVNVLAPGCHETPAIARVIQKKVDNSDDSLDEVKQQMEASIPVGRFGKGDEIASLAAWLLSPHAGYVTGQTISHDGGNIKGLFA